MHSCADNNNVCKNSTRALRAMLISEFERKSVVNDDYVYLLCCLVWFSCCSLASEGESMVRPLIPYAITSHNDYCSLINYALLHSHPVYMSVLSCLFRTRFRDTLCTSLRSLLCSHPRYQGCRYRRPPVRHWGANSRGRLLWPCYSNPTPLYKTAVIIIIAGDFHLHVMNVN